MKKRGLFVIASLILMLISATLQAGGLKILFIGDSITDGNWGSGDGKPSSERTLWDMNHIYGHGFMYLCASHYLGEYPQYEYEFFNRGISGNRVVDLYARWKVDALNLKPDYLSILIGVNDVWHEIEAQNGVEAKKYEKIYTMLLEETLEALPDIKIILMEPFVLHGTGTDKAWDVFSQEVAKRQEAVHRIADTFKLPLVRLQDKLNEAERIATASYWLGDGVHPTPAGHALLTDQWIRVFKTMI